MEVVINVKGMTCSGCEKSVRNALTNLNGVEDVAIDLKTGQVNVAYNQEEIGLEKICNEIEEIGYDVVK